MLKENIYIFVGSRVRRLMNKMAKMVKKLDYYEQKYCNREKQDALYKDSSMNQKEEDTIHKKDPGIILLISTHTTT